MRCRQQSATLHREGHPGPTRWTTIPISSIVARRPQQACQFSRAGRAAILQAEAPHSRPRPNIGGNIGG